MNAGNSRCTGVDAVRIAVWGLGNHARRKILPALARCRNVQLLGVTTRNAAVAGEVAKQYGCVVWADPDAMLRDPRVDVVYVSTPTGTHFEGGMRALRAGKHLWCEKPLTHDTGQSLTLLSEARRRGLAACEALMYLHHPHFCRLLETVGGPSFGPVRSVTCRFGIPHQARDGFRYSASEGGGALLDVGCYPVSAALAILGTDVQVITSLTDRPAEFEVDTGGCAVLESRSGARALLEWGYGLPYRNELFVWGLGQSVYVDRVFSKAADFESSLVISDGTGVCGRVTVPAADSFAVMFDDLARAAWNQESRACEWDRTEAQANLMGAIAAKAVPSAGSMS